MRRFRPFDRNLHLMVITSFLGLAMTGMMLKFSYTRWAQVLSHLLGGFEGAGLIHRFCAVLTFTYFGLHLWDLLRQRRASGKTWRQFIFGPESMVFNRTRRAGVHRFAQMVCGQRAAPRIRPLDVLGEI